MAFNIKGQQVSKTLIQTLIQQYPKVQVQKLDWKRYLEDNPDLKEGNIINQLDAYNHAIHHGIYNGGRKLFDVEGNIFKYTFKKVIYESEISKKIPSEEAAYLDYCNSDTTCLHPYLKIKEPYMKYKSKISETFQEIEKIIVNYYSVDDLLINNHELHKLIDLLDVLNECREEDQDTKDEEKKLLEAAEYLDTVKNTKTMETMRITEKERHDLLKKREDQAKAMAEKLKKEQEEKLKQQRLENDAAVKRKELEKNQKQQEEQKIKAAQSKIVEDMLVLQRKKRALDQRIRLEVTEKKKFFEEDKMNTLVMDILNQKEVDLKGKKILLNTHTMLSVAAGDTIMISNIVNLFLNINSHVVILTKYNVGDVFLNNLISDNYTIVQKEDDKEIMDFIDENHTDFACLFFRNHEILQALKGKFYLYKTILYGLEIHLEGISKLNNNFLYTLTQSEELRNMYIEKGISKEKINILDIITVKYDFELPERKDNEIRLIYSGTLRNEENILEIIEEFQKIHKERPEVVLKIVYGKIVDNGKGFKAKVEKIIENGVKGIIFKNGLSHKDACYEIATSDIGICWRKDGWGDDGQVSTKVKEYEMYGLNIIFDKILFKYKIIVDIILIKHNISDFLKMLVKLKNKYQNVKLFPYVLHNAFPYDSGGYATRTHNILNTFNNMYSDKQYFALHRIGYPYDSHKMKHVEKFLHGVDNVCYLTLPNLKCYNYLLNLLKNTFNITTFHVASAYKNAIPIINYCNMENISSIYEVRGMWQITGLSRHKYYNTNYTEQWLDNYGKNEKYCIENCSIPLFITRELQEYALDNKKYSFLSPLNCNIQKTPIFWNCYNIDENILCKTKIYKKGDKFIIGYAGSIVFYEGIVEIIGVIEKLVEKKYNIEFRLIGNIQPIIDEYKNKNKNRTQLDKVFNKPFVKLYGKVPHDEVINIISKFDIYVIPRIDLPVTNMVSPIKPFEPMSLKIPLLMSDCDCLKDISHNGKNCVLFKKNNWDDCFEQIKNIIDNGYPEDILENGYNFVKNERNWKFMIEHIGLYDMLD